MVGKAFSDFLHPKDKKRILKLFLSAWKQPNMRPQLEFRTVHKRGHLVHMYSAPTILRNAKTITGFAAIITDVSNRKKAEEALHESEEKFRSLSEQSPNGLSKLMKAKSALRVKKAKVPASRLNSRWPNKEARGGNDEKADSGRR